MALSTWFISDSHTHHWDLEIPDCQMVCHCGDESNSRETFQNLRELKDFMEWFDGLNIKHKVFVPGNHSTALERLPAMRQEMSEICHFLDHKEVEIEGLKIFGSPFTPKFGKGWVYNVARDKIGRKWNQIPKDTDILLSHGPCYGVGDLTEDMDTGNVISVGDTALLKAVKRLDLKLHVFGHLHSNRNSKHEIHNAGIYQLAGLKTKFINASLVRDGEMEIYHNGFVLEI